MSSLKDLQSGRYAVLEKLGEGGKGIVYKVRDTVLDRVVAVKVLKSEVLSEETYSRVMREARVVAKLDHPNIVSIYDIGKEADKQFFVLAFVDGMNLRGLMGTYHEGKCDLQTVLRIGMDVCGALQYAHSQGVLHRDIKPENILITEEGTAKLMDFGLAKALGGTRITKRGMIVGTPAYLPPEQALGNLKNWNMEYEASVKYFNEAVMLLKETGDKKGLARVNADISYILVYTLGRYEDALAHYDEALKILENEPESPELAKVYADMALMYLWSLGDISKAVSLGRKALSLAEKLDVLVVKAQCYCELTFTELVDLQKATEYIEEGLKIALENNFTELAVIDGYFYLPLYYMALGDFHRAMEYAEEGLEFARKVGCLSWSGYMTATIAEVYWSTGDLQKTIETSEEAIQTSKKTGHLYSLIRALEMLGATYQTMGEWDKAYECYVQALEIAKRAHFFLEVVWVDSSLGRLCYEKQEYNKAEEILQKQIKVLEKGGGKTRCPVQFLQWDFVPYIWLSEVHLKTGKFKKAKDLADEIYEVAVKSKSKLYMAMANRLKGMVLSHEKDWESAIEFFEKSKREFEAMDALPELIPTLYEYGSTYLQRNQEGDREKAHSLLDQALEISRKIGAKKWIEKIIAKKKLLTA